MQKIISIYISWFVFATLAALTLPIKGVYISLLLLLALPMLLVKPKLVLQKQDVYLIIFLLIAFLFYLGHLIFRPESIRLLDRNLRWLFYIGIFLLFIKYPVNHKWVQAGILLGAIFAGCFASYEKIKNPAARAGEHINPIQFGSFSMLLSLLSAVIFNYHLIQYIKNRKKINQTQLDRANCAKNKREPNNGENEVINSETDQSNQLIAALRTNKMSMLWIGFSCTAIIAGLLGSIYSGSRGGWISATLFIYIIFFQYSQSFDLSKKIKTFLFVLFIFILTAIYFNPKLDVSTRIKAAKNDIQNYIEHNHVESSVGARLEMWRVALVLFKEKPILGWGHEGYQQKIKLLSEEKKTSAFLNQFNEPHNQFLDAAAKHGVLGLLLMTGVYFWTFRYFLKQSNNLKNTITGMFAISGMVSMLAFFDFSLTHSFINKTAGLSVYLFFLTLFWSLSRRN